ncbi:hypothetical protein FSP39_006505 [Pinctada imbricata]|uniref:Cyclic nucleotide-binding domain-containing protein n=1 Tax=Pinctada imbricata TaxID=66713 RepID=A0AA88YHN1_PINIB|nr:hypothetical protein FSP39_006505 [Pinctada imbricata]
MPLSKTKVAPEKENTSKPKDENKKTSEETKTDKNDAKKKEDTKKAPTLADKKMGGKWKTAIDEHIFSLRMRSKMTVMKFSLTHELCDAYGEMVIAQFTFFAKMGYNSNAAEKSPASKKLTRIVNAQQQAKKFRKASLKEPDPFLERFTVVSRAHTIEEVNWYFKDLFTRKFWKEVVLDPAEAGYYWWSFIACVSVMYNLIVVIMRASFYDQLNIPEFMKYWFIFDYICDGVYIFDMFIKSRIGFLEQGLLVRDTKRLAKVYLTSWKFIADIIAIIPLDFLYLAVGFEALLRLNKCLKVWRVGEFFQLAETHTNFPNLLRVINLILIIIVIIHWNGCIYFSISRALGFGSDGWAYPDTTQDTFSDFLMMYVYSYYWSCLTLTTIGDTPYPEHALEFTYCIVCSLMGVLIFATIFGNVGSLINEMDAARNEFQHKVDAVKRYMEIRQVSSSLQERVVKWFDYTWNNKQSVDDKAALEFLPEKLKAEIAIHVHLQTLRRVELFKDCEPGLLTELVLKLKLQVFSPGDYICRKGDIGKEMYIIKRGKLQVVSEDGKKIFVTLGAGAVFGEISILNIPGNKTGNRRTASVRSVGYSDLFCLSKLDLLDALTEYPDARKMLNEIGKQKLVKDGLIDEEAARREERKQQNLDKKIELIADAVDDLHNEVKRLIEKISKKKEEKESSMKKKSADKVDVSTEEPKKEDVKKEQPKDEKDDTKQAKSTITVKEVVPKKEEGIVDKDGKQKEGEKQDTISKEEKKEEK